MRNAEFTGNRPGDEAVGGGDDGAQVAVIEVTLNEGARLAGNDWADAGGHEFGVPGVEAGARIVGQRLELEIEKLVDIQCAGLVLLEKFGVFSFECVAVKHAFADQVLCPFVVAVAGEQRVIKIEEGEVHGGACQ